MQVVLNNRVVGELLFNEHLAPYTSWRVGGPAEQLFIPEDKAGLCAFLQHLGGQKTLFWMGLGSNLLIRDGGISGVVINTRGRLKQMFLQANGELYVEAGVPCAHVARFCAEQGLVGAEFLAGIPGTMGGALKMNAGAFNGCTWDLVNSVETVDNMGVGKKRPATEFVASYRQVAGLGEQWFLAAWLNLQPGDTQSSQEKIRQLLAKRAATQPTNKPSCGSVFKNPEGDYAARLIEAAGLKGYQIGGACVSEKHANFIINSGNALAADIETLIHQIQQHIEQQYGIKLQTEVCCVGTP